MKDDLAAAGSAIMEQLSGRMDGVVESLGWAGTKVSWRCQGRFTDPEWMARWWRDEGDGTGGRRTAMILGILQIGPELVEVGTKSIARIEREIKTANDGFVA